MRRAAMLGMAVVVVGLPGCGGDDGEKPAAANSTTMQHAPKPQPATQSSPGLTAEAADSGIEGVSVPKSAESVDGESWTVPGASYLEVVGWYEDQMPEGQDFRRWDWCDTGGGPGVSDNETIHAHIYARGSREILNVSVINDQPAGILIGSDQSGPC